MLNLGYLFIKLRGSLQSCHCLSVTCNYQARALFSLTLWDLCGSGYQLWFADMGEVHDACKKEYKSGCVTAVMWLWYCQLVYILVSLIPAAV